MILGIKKEIFTFLQAILTGNIICLVYNALRVFRRILKHPLFWVSCEDIIFWIWAGFFLFARIHKTSSGSIRWYFVVGALLGSFLTHVLIRKIVKKYIAKTNKKE